MFSLNFEELYSSPLLLIMDTLYIYKRMIQHIYKTTQGMIID